MNFAHMFKNCLIRPPNNLRSNYGPHRQVYDYRITFGNRSHGMTNSDYLSHDMEIVPELLHKIYLKAPCDHFSA